MSTPTRSNAAASLLVSALAELVVEVVESKCAKLKPRERTTLERRIGRAVETFVEGMQLSPQQRRANEKLESMQAPAAPVLSSRKPRKRRR